MYKFGLLVTAAAFSLAGAASALPTYGFSTAATPDAPFAGPYVGVHGGYAWDRDSTTTLFGASAPNQAAIVSGARPFQFQQDKGGYVAGGQVGWNVQRGPIVAGVELDMSATDFGQRVGRTGLTGARTSLASDYDYFATARARLGAVVHGVLLYGTGGYATTQVTDRALLRTSAGLPGFTASHEYQPDGFVAGGGAEYLLPAAWSDRLGGRFIGSGHVALRAEYLHYEFNGKLMNIGSVGSGAVGTAGGYAARVSNQADVVRGGLSYKF